MSTETPAVCVIGHPVAHSRSPLIHNYWLKQHGIAGEYRREDVKPEALGDFLKGMHARGYVGANVTLPHKQAALDHAEPDERAQAVGAANTLWFEDGKLRATNTDVEGFLGNLDECAPQWDQFVRTATVLGGGGAARAALHALVSRRVGRIFLVNRTLAKAEELRRVFGERVHPRPWDYLGDALAASALFVNTTSLGMTGQPPLDVDISPLPGRAVVYDTVYTPLETKLLQKAKAAGLFTADGLGMLLHQAVRGFSLWFGVTPQVTPELRALLERDLAS